VGIFLCSLLGVYTLLQIFTAFIPGASDGSQHWVASLAFNMLGYATIFLPGYLIIRYVRRAGYLERGPPKCMQSLVRVNPSKAYEP